MRALAVAVAAVAAVLAVLPAAVRARDDTSIRCAGGLVAIGDATIDLLGKCGEPTLREGHTDLTTVVYTTASGAPARATAVGVERWTYDFGPSRFVVIVTVTGGRVTAIGGGTWGNAAAEPVPLTPPRARCEPTALHVGDLEVHVLARCGPAALVERRDDLLRLTPDQPAPGVLVTRTVVVTVEVWTYDFGPQSFVRFVTFEDGVVTRIDTGSHGYAR
jgi:hypothetical protein